MIDCKAHTYDTPVMIQTAPNGAIIATDRHRTSAATMAPIDPDTMADAVYMELCEAPL